MLGNGLFQRVISFNGSGNDLVALRGIDMTEESL